MIIYLDTETTGLRPGQICQLSLILQEGKSIRTKNYFFTVDFVEYSALKIHGFSVEKLRQLSKGKTFSDYAEEIAGIFEKAEVIVAHNTAFDFMFLRAEFERANQNFFVKEQFCSMKNMTSACKLPSSKGLGYKFPKLSELCNYFKISDKDIAETALEIFGESADFHDARFDTTAVFLAVNKGIKSEPVLRRLKEFL